MKTPSFALVVLTFCYAFLVAAQSEDPGPSPTASVGCEPHGDHWDCDGPRVDATAASSTAAAAETTHDENAPVTGSADPGPSPTASIGCEPHGDHWDCDAPAPTAGETLTATSGIVSDTATALPTSSAAPAEITGGSNALRLDYRISAVGGLLSLAFFFIAV